MDRLTYIQMCAHAGRSLLRSMPDALPLDDDQIPLDIDVAVYIIEDRLGEVLYVGSVHRQADTAGLARRLREHMGNNGKSMTWQYVTLIALKPETSRAEVRRIEGVVAFDLRPRSGERHPREWLTEPMSR
jgi:hypothetical protein